jgi:hypothetical protein
MPPGDDAPPAADPCVAKAAGDLQDTLGQRLTAYAVGVRDPRVIDAVARAEVRPRAHTAEALCELHSITRRLVERETPDSARAWLLCSSPLLDHRAPVEVLHEDACALPGVRTRRVKDAYRRVAHAANQFLDAA